MRRHLLIVAVLGFFGVLGLSSDASACHKKKCAPAPCAPAPCAAPAPCVVETCPPPAPVCEPAPKGCHKKFKLFGCFKKKSCAAPVVYAAPCAAPVVYAAPSAQSYPSAQYVAPSGQGY